MCLLIFGPVDGRLFGMGRESFRYVKHLVDAGLLYCAQRGNNRTYCRRCSRVGLYVVSLYGSTQSFTQRATKCARKRWCKLMGSFRLAGLVCQRLVVSDCCPRHRQTFRIMCINGTGISSMITFQAWCVQISALYVTCGADRGATGSTRNRKYAWGRAAERVQPPMGFVQAASATVLENFSVFG